MGVVTKATPIQLIDSKSCIKKWRGHKAVLSGYYACLSRDLLLMASGANTHTHTNHRYMDYIHGIGNGYSRANISCPNNQFYSNGYHKQ